MIIVLIYIFLVVFTLPILYLTVALGFAYTKAFDSKLKGYAFGFVFITSGIMAGAVIAMLLARYVFGKTLKRKFLSKIKSF